MHRRQRRGTAAWALLGAGVAAGALLSAGCGSSGTDPTARIRAVDLSGNAGTTGVLVNGAANGGDLNFGNSSPYNYVGQGLSTFGFTTTVAVPTGAIYPVSPTLQLNNNLFYTAYLIGRVDVANIGAKADPRFIQTVVTGDKGAAANYASGPAYADPPSGQANIRLLNGAPDAGTVDVLINGQKAFASVTYPAFPTLTSSGSTSGNAVTPATTYQAFAAGTVSVQVNAAGTETVLVPPTNLAVSSGKAYTIVVTEPTIAPTFGLYLAGDQQ